MIKENILISNKISALDSLSVMDQTKRKLLIICDGKKFLGVISIGDIQRALLSKLDLSQPVTNYIRDNITYALVTDDLASVKEKMLAEKIEAMPIIDADGYLCDVIEWEQLFASNVKIVDEPINLPVVIMAGGKGTRLLPLTNVIPKPLIPVSDKTIVEEIMTRFKLFGCNKFYLSVNYMMDTIKTFFVNRPEWDVSFLQEHSPLGTAGSLYLLKNVVSGTFIVTNCDTLIDVNFNDLINYHRTNNNSATVVSAIRTIHIPYGTIDTEKDGVISRVTEKPDLYFQINCGLYVFESEVLNYIDDDVYLNIPDLIDKLINDGKRVGAFPVPESSWVDMGNWNEYLKIINKSSD